eukprot:2905247-Rhodomonas_salina.1
MGKRRGRRRNNQWKQFQSAQVRETVRSEQQYARQKREFDKEDQTSPPSSLHVWHLLSRPNPVPAEEIFRFFSQFGNTCKVRYVNNNKACRVDFDDASTMQKILAKAFRNADGKLRLDTPNSRIGFQGFIMVEEARNPAGSSSPAKVYRAKGRHVRIGGTRTGLGVYNMPQDDSLSVRFYQEFEEGGMTLNFNFA